METKENGRRRWIDTTINLQALVFALVGAAIALAGVYTEVVRRADALENRDREHDQRFTRIESDMRQQRDDTNQQVRALGNDMKEQLSGVSNDVKEIRRYLMDNAAGQRPDIRRWAR